MRQADIELLLDHLFFVRDRVLAAAREAPDALDDPAPPTIRDLHATLVHEVDVEWSWRDRLDSDHPAAFDDAEDELTVGDLPTIDAIETRWRIEETAMRDWVARLGDAGLEGPCDAESPGRHPMWFHVVHLYTHGIQQLADAATLLTAAGRSPGELDFLDYVESREREGRPLGGA